MPLSQVHTVYVDARRNRLSAVCTVLSDCRTRIIETWRQTNLFLFL